VSQSSDYSKLAAEILHMIANHAAAVHIHEEDDLKISRDLFKMRLVCRSFYGAATAVFVSLAHMEKFSNYRVLNLPSKSVSFPALKSIFE